MDDPFDMSEAPPSPPSTTRSLPDLIGAAILALLLLILPVFGAGPDKWRSGGAAEPAVSEQKIINEPPAKPLIVEPASKQAPVSSPDAPSPEPSSQQPAPAPIEDTAQAPDGPAPTASVYFAFNESRVPTGVELTLEKVIAYLKLRDASKARIVGFHDASGRNLDQNRKLANDRAASVRAALIAAGISADRITVDAPSRAENSSSPREARRVEVIVLE